jgi:hypothetical protein
MLEDKYKIKVNDKKTRHRTYVSIDGNHRFKSLFENIFYNIFVQYGFADKLIYESREFYADCQKIPDFKLEDEKLVVEIGGMEKQEYWEKLENAKECFNKKGYNTKTAFADVLGYSPQYYINLSNGVHETSVVSLQRLLKNAQRLPNSN